MAHWPVNQARNHWSDVLDQAESDGPQIITHHGKERAVVLSIESYRALQPEPATEKPDFISYLLGGPRIDFEDSDFEIRYPAEQKRDADLSALFEELEKESR